MTATDPVVSFAEAARQAGASVSRTTAVDVTETITSVVEGTAVAAPFPFGDPILPEGVVVDPDPTEIRAANTGITAAVLGVVPYGSVVIAPAERREGSISLYPERQVAIVREEDLVPDLGTALTALDERFQSGQNDAVFVTGPSTTGDMGELVTGVHGPGELYVIVIEEATTVSGSVTEVTDE